MVGKDQMILSIAGAAPAGKVGDAAIPGQQKVETLELSSPEGEAASGVRLVLKPEGVQGTSLPRMRKSLLSGKSCSGLSLKVDGAFGRVKVHLGNEAKNQEWWSSMSKPSTAHRKALASLTMLVCWVLWNKRNARMFSL